MNIRGNIVDITGRKIYFGEVHVQGSVIEKITELGEEDVNEVYIMPGFVDAHVHIESSMLTPSQFARMAVVHGTVGTVSDPHEIANVLGVAGVRYMIEDGRQVPFHFAFGAPSCVPATSFETAGAIIDASDIREMMQWDDIYYLAEMMNYPGAIHGDGEVLAKIKAAQDAGKPIDGHAPGLMGEDMERYFQRGISTDHECYLKEEAEAKLKAGVKVLIREGSAAKNFETLIPLAKNHAQQMMFCSDDKHPDDLEAGHINQLVKRAIDDHGIDFFDALYMACIHPVIHYQLPIGLLREGDNADFVVFSNKTDWLYPETFVSGVMVASEGVTEIDFQAPVILNNFKMRTITENDIAHGADFQGHRAIIEVFDGQLITGRLHHDPPVKAPDPATDVLKLVVVNRYNEEKPAVAYIKGFGIKDGALASSIAHDSHNIIAVGSSDACIVRAINLIMENEGGICGVSPDDDVTLPLPIAGLISELDGYMVAEKYKAVHQFAREDLGSSLTSPFMSLSFMALLVIPELKLSDKGLFDGKRFEFVG